jgi:hypothetical protein
MGTYSITRSPGRARTGERSRASVQVRIQPSYRRRERGCCRCPSFHFFQAIPPRVPDGRGQNLDSDSLPFVEDGDEVDPSHPGSVFEAHEVATDRGNSFFAARRIAHPGGVKIGRGVRGNQRILPEAAPSCAAWMRTSAGSRSSRSVISTSPAARGAPSRRTRSNICVHILRKASCPSQHRLSICWRRQLQRRHDRHADAKHKHGRLRSL